MKKILTIFVLAAIIFTGCKHKTDEDSDNVTKTVKINRDGEVYLIKLNTTGKTIYDDDTGYVSDVKRSISDESYTDTDFYIRSMNNKFAQGLIQSESGARSAARAVGQDKTDLDEIALGHKQKYYSIVGQKKDRSGNLINVSDQINTTCKYVGKHCIVYADDNNPKILNSTDYISNSSYTFLGQKFDKVYEEVIKIIGNPVYDKYIDTYFVPCTTKITILVSDLFGDAQENQDSGTVGYFYSADLFKQSFLDTSTSFNAGLSESEKDYIIHSNEREMFYIDTTFLKLNPNVVYSTLVHEFNHMINFVIKTLNTMTSGQKNLNNAQACDTWFTEMLAMVTEDMFQEYLGLDDEHSPKARLPNFGIYYYYGFRNWNNDKVDQLCMYANTYAFGAFLARNFGGIPLIKEIAQNSYVDEMAITKALQTVNAGKTYEDDITHEQKPYDFYYALKKFPLCTIYTEYGYEYSLNNTTGFENKSNIGFRAVDIAFENVRIGENYYTLPIKFKYGKGGRIDILSNGFTVHHVGTNISSFTMKIPKYSKLEYYYVIK